MSLALATPGAASPPSLPGSGSRDLTSQFLTFSLAGRPYGVPLGQVAEITPTQKLSHIPHMPKSVEGLLDIRGQVLPVINLRSRLGLPEDAALVPENIIILDLEGHRVGILVDHVLSVVTASHEDYRQASPLLAGIDGKWVSGFLVRQGSVVVLLDTHVIAATGQSKAHHNPTAASLSMERRLEEGLRQLIEEAPAKQDTEFERSRIIPSIEQAISHTEKETQKVIDCIESMLAHTDQAFTGITCLKQEARLGRMRELESHIAEIERIGQRLQDNIFETLNQLQFQDIARQKLERVLTHISGMQKLVGTRFRDSGRARKG